MKRNCSPTLTVERKRRRTKSNPSRRTRLMTGRPLQVEQYLCSQADLAGLSVWSWENNEQTVGHGQPADQWLGQRENDWYNAHDENRVRDDNADAKRVHAAFLNTFL